MQGGYFKTKRVHIFINGNNQSKAFNIHPRCRLGWNAILDCFSKTLKPNFGAIRVIRTIDGRKVIEGFNDLQHEGKYVACGLEVFRTVKGGYLTNSETRIKPKHTEYYPTKSLSPDDQKKYPCLIQTMRKGRIIIYVFANGKKADPKKVVLIKSDYEAWDSILKHIGNILDIPEGVKGMYTVFGQPLCSPYEIQHGGYYVAIPFNASFKSIQYLEDRNIHSYHESSPMITKETYIAASKTCTFIEGPSRKQRRSITTKVDDTSAKKNVQSSNEDKLEHHVRIEGFAVRDKEVSEVHENEIHITNYFQKEGFTQTSTIFLEATCDEDQGLLLNQKKYFLVPERELQKFGSVDKSEWYEGLLNGASEIEQSDADKNKIATLAGTMISVIVYVSQKVARRTFYGNSEMEVSVDGAGISLKDDSNQTEILSIELHQKNDSAEHEDRRQSVVSKDRPLRLSIPIGRLAPNFEQPNKEMESSSDIIDTTDIIHGLDKDYKPLTPLHDLGTSALDLCSERGIEVDISGEESSYILKHLKKDSLGIPSAEEYPVGEQEYDDEDSDEWKKLDILEDMGISSENEIGSVGDLFANEGEHNEDDEVLSDEYKLSDGEGSLVRMATCCSHEFFDDDLDGIQYCKRCHEYVKAEEAAKQQAAHHVDGKDDHKLGGSGIRSNLSHVENNEMGTVSPTHIGSNEYIDIPYVNSPSKDEGRNGGSAECVKSPHQELAHTKTSSENENSSSHIISKEHKEPIYSEIPKGSTLLDKEEPNISFKRVVPVESDKSKDKSEQTEVTIIISEKLLSDDDGKKATLELVEGFDDENVQVLDYTKKSPPQSLTDYEYSSIYSQPVTKSEPAVNVECVKHGSFVGILEDRRTALNTWDKSVESVLRKSFVDSLQGPSNSNQLEEPASEQYQNRAYHGIDNKMVSTDTTTTGTEEERLSLTNYLKVNIETALNRSLPHLNADYSE